MVPDACTYFRTKNWTFYFVGEGEKKREKIPGTMKMDRCTEKPSGWHRVKGKQ